MSTVVATQPVTRRQPVPQGLRERMYPFAHITLLTVLALFVHGYHPYAEDGGLYAAGIKHLLNPALYPHSLRFVEAHQRFSLFAPAVATVVRLTHLRLDIILLGLYLMSIWVTLFAVWLLARRCYSNRAAQTGATMLVAAWMTVPIAGTSLILMDPYLTARNISLPCTLLAVAATLDIFDPTFEGKKLRSLILCASLLLLAAFVHPLMAAYALGNVLVLAAILTQSPKVKRWGTAALCVLAIGIAGLLQATTSPDSAAYIQVAVTRYYWFLSRWQWYELVGLAAPLLILLYVASRQQPHASRHQSTRKALAMMAIAVGATAVIVSLNFAHEASASHLVARLQPLRTFQTVYILMILVLGATLGEYLLRRSVWLWAVAFALFGGIFFYVQRSTYPSSAHVEWPGIMPSNRWEQAFLWIRQNTPPDAFFAMDANYISLHGEDAQSFRAIAERSALPDYSKDGGEASITPSLTDAWDAGQRAQAHLSFEDDTKRLATLRPTGADWIVLLQQAETGFDCPYRNELVKVCRLP